ncbi:type VII secretion system-associated protein [Streptomyces sp. NPDC098781]|uniref:type VII secretion system-associated protein n=1 Tax=Streptomyces sp. NPDC098781 TaxID=3366097 RepID=UPI0038239002
MSDVPQEPGRGPADDVDDRSEDTETHTDSAPDAGGGTYVELDVADADDEVDGHGEGDGLAQPEVAVNRASTQGQEVIPAPPPELLAVARQSPDHWFYMPDPNWMGDGPPPEWALIGRWRTDGAGRIVEWEENEGYRPSPEALGWPEPTDPVDAAVQGAATGYGPQEDVLRSLAAVDRIAVLVQVNGDLLVTTNEDGTMVPFFTLAPHLDGIEPEELPAHEIMSVHELLLHIPEEAERVLYLSPSAPVSMALEVKSLVDALGDAGAESTPEDQTSDDETSEDVTVDDVADGGRPPATVGADGPAPAAAEQTVSAEKSEPEATQGEASAGGPA